MADFQVFLNGKVIAHRTSRLSAGDLRRKMVDGQGYPAAISVRPVVTVATPKATKASTLR